MYHLFVTFEDYTGAQKEIDITALQLVWNGGQNTEEEIIQSYVVNNGMKVVSTRRGLADSFPPTPTPAGVGCLLSVLSIFGF